MGNVDIDCSKQTVYLFTNKFPFGFGETFLEAEMDSLQNDFDMVVIPTQSHLSNDHGRAIMNNCIKVDAFLCDRSRLEYYLCSLSMLFSKLFHEELNRRKKRGILSIKQFVQILGYYGRSKQIARAMIKKYGGTLDKRNSILYSYWLTEASLAEILIKRKLGIYSISRAHGVDVYDGRCVYDTIPGQFDVVKNIDKIFVCSKNGRNYLQEKYPAYKKNISYSYLGSIDYGFNAGDNRSKAFTLISCSRLVPGKRVHLIAKALSNIKDRNIHWIHIGDGRERTRIYEELKDFPKNISCEFLGDIDHEEVMKYYLENPVNLFISVSESEGLPVSIMEATSFGIPVIATNVGGTNEVVNNDLCDLIPPDFEMRDLVDRIYKYVDMDSYTYSSIREGIRSYWLQNFCALDNYSTFYENLLKSK